MPKVQVTTFVVRGRYGFPFDMLRYDQAWPTDRGVSVLSAVARGSNLEIIDEEKETTRWVSVEIELRTHGHVTPDRWSSFGWTVTSQSTRAY